MITKDDPFHIHKTLGIACLISFVFRLLQIGESNMGFRTFPHLTIPTLVLHLLLNLSALTFPIPNKRIASGYRIWPQYRLHSLVFLSRALITMLIIYVEENNVSFFNRPFDIFRSTAAAGAQQEPLEPNYDWNFLLVLVCMIAADVASSTTPAPYRSNTIRDLDTSPAVRCGFILAQFYGTAVILFGVRRYTIPMLSVIVVQGNAFLMTVRRKNLASHQSLVTVYGAALMVCAGISVYEFKRQNQSTNNLSNLRIVATCGQVAFLWRTAPLSSLSSWRLFSTTKKSPSWMMSPFRSPSTLTASSSSSIMSDSSPELHATWCQKNLNILFGSAFWQSKYVVWGTIGLVLRTIRLRLHQYTWSQVYLVHFCTLVAVV